MNSLIDTLVVGVTRQANIIAALIIREVRLRNSKYPFAQLVDLSEAVIYIIAHWVIFVYLHHHLPIGDSLLTFIATGIFPILFFRTMTIRAAGGIESSKHLKGIPNLQPIDYAVARLLVEFIAFSLAFCFLFVMVSALGLSKFAIPYKLGPVAFFGALMAIFALGIGLINSFLIYLFPLWKFFWSMISRVQIFFSGVFFIPEYMPPQMKEILSYNPLMHFVSLFRTAFYPTYPTNMLSIEYITYWSLGALFVGLALERSLKSRRTY